MLIRRPSDIRPSEITDEALYIDRRRFLALTGALGAAAAGVSGCQGGEGDEAR